MKTYLLAGLQLLLTADAALPHGLIQGSLGPEDVETTSWALPFSSSQRVLGLHLTPPAFPPRLSSHIQCLGESGDLVQVSPDTVLWLVEIMVLSRQLSYTTKTQLKQWFGTKSPSPPFIAQYLGGFGPMRVDHSVHIWFICELSSCLL